MPRNVYLWDATLPLEDELVDRRGGRTTDVVNNRSDVTKNSIVIGTLPLEDDLEIVAIGLVQRKSGVARGRSGITVDPVLVFKPRLRSALVAQMPKRQQGYIARAGDPKELYPVKLPPTAADALLAALSEDPQVAEWLLDLEAPPPQMHPNKEIVLRETRDAISLALQIAEGTGDRADRGMFNAPHHIPVTDDVLAAVMDDAYLNDIEDDQLAQEVRRFKADTKVTPGSGSTATLEGSDYRLIVFNVNRKPLEHVLGVDLVYWDLERNIFTMLQYKRMQRQRDEDSGRWGDWHYTDEEKIKKALNLMQEYKLHREEARLSKNWRMASPYWFKFVHHDAGKRDDGELLKGFYVAAPHLKLAIEDKSLRIGEKGGFYVTDKYPLQLNKTVFADLVIRGAIGTAGAQSDHLAKIVTTSAMRDRNVIIAIKEKWAESFDQSDDDLSVLFRPSRPSSESGGVGNMDDLLKKVADDRDADDGGW